MFAKSVSDVAVDCRQVAQTEPTSIGKMKTPDTKAKRTTKALVDAASTFDQTH